MYCQFLIKKVQIFMSFFLLYFITFIVLLFIDSLWIFNMMFFYKKHIGYLFSKNFIFFPALLFYLLYSFSLLYLIINSSKNYKELLVKSSLFGLTCYATFNLTNNTLIYSWPSIVTLVDSFWGSLGAIIVSSIVWYIKFNVIK